MTISKSKPIKTNFECICVHNKSISLLGISSNTSRAVRILESEMLNATARSNTWQRCGVSSFQVAFSNRLRNTWTAWCGLFLFFFSIACRFFKACECSQKSPRSPRVGLYSLIEARCVSCDRRFFCASVKPHSALHRLLSLAYHYTELTGLPLNWRKYPHPRFQCQNSNLIKFVTFLWKLLYFYLI